jgi:hypothetical protein
MQPGHGLHEIFPVNAQQGRPTVTTYAVRRPDTQWAILAINKDPKRAAMLTVGFRFSETRPIVTFSGKIDITQFSREQYAWHDDGPNGRPTRSLAAVHFRRQAGTSYTLPPYSITVLRGMLTGQNR